MLFIGFEWREKMPRPPAFAGFKGPKLPRKGFSRSGDPAARARRAVSMKEGKKTMLAEKAENCEKVSSEFPNFNNRIKALRNCALRLLESNVDTSFDRIDPLDFIDPLDLSQSSVFFLLLNLHDKQYYDESIQFWF